MQQWGIKTETWRCNAQAAAAIKAFARIAVKHFDSTVDFVAR